MKKIIAIVVALMLMCSLAGCISTNSDFKAEYKESKVVTLDTSDGTMNMLLLFFECTNEGDRNITPMDGKDIDAFQNGVALSFHTLYDLDEMGDAIPCDTALQSGASATVVWFFELRDDSPVSVEVDGESFTVNVK